MSDLEQFEPARPRRRRPRSPHTLLFLGVLFLAAGVAWSAAVAALWSWTPETLGDRGLTLVGCVIASVICYTLGLASLVAWKHRRR